MGEKGRKLYLNNKKNVFKKKRYGKGWLFLGALRKESIFLPFPASRSCLHSLVHDRRSMCGVRNNRLIMGRKVSEVVGLEHKWCKEVVQGLQGILIKAS